MQAASRFGCGKADTGQLVDERIFQRDKNLNELDFRYVKRNAKVVGNYCKAHKSDTVMNAMQKNWR